MPTNMLIENIFEKVLILNFSKIRIPNTSPDSQFTQQKWPSPNNYSACRTAAVRTARWLIQTEQCSSWYCNPVDMSRLKRNQSECSRLFCIAIESLHRLNP